jgi:dTDP-4-amino-4,6-dideoxy-D-glucose ammonia-lyase
MTSSTNPPGVALAIPSEIALIGGGRWARVWYGVLSSLSPRPRIHWVSSRNRDGVAAWMAGLDTPGGPAARLDDLYDSLDSLVANARPPVAIVANLPVEHERTVRTLLKHGCHVLVEKPFVPTLERADALIAVAARHDRVLAVGLELMLASYAGGFRRILQASGARPVAAEVVWRDAARDVRYAALKTPDLTTSIVGDLMPHVLSLLTAVQGAADVEVDSASASNGGLETEVRLRYGGLPVTVSLSRSASRPERVVRFLTASGEHYTLDFTTEPGVIITPAGERIPDEQWADVPRPLNALLHLFLEGAAGPGGDAPILASRTRHIVAGTEAAAQALTESQMLLLRPFLLRDTDRTLPSDALVALREQVAGPLVAEGLVANPKAEDELNRWALRAWGVIHRFARHPFTTQREMADVLGLDPPTLVRLNRALRQSESAQQLMVEQGVAMKYWENTILPLLQAGVIESARQGTSRHPFRVGVYPGVSCMFHCSFCGRHPDASYARDTVPPGNAMFDAMFRDAPSDPYTFYVSGGLEPLTNPGIGQLIAAGAARGFRLSLYTNGFMLTPQLLARQPGIWDLDTLRISLYGVDTASTTEVTCHPKAHGQVVQNAVAFLQARNARESSLKFGFNFVVLPGHVEEVLTLVELIASINRAAGGRQVDFLTLREDYSVPPDRGLTRGERERLAEIFEQLRSRVQQPDLCELKIDLGYALHSLSEGGWPTPLDMVEHRAMRPTGYPQVSVVVDLLGDVYLYREAGFLDRPGARRYVIGRVGPDRSLHEVVTEFLASGRTIDPQPGDTGYFDIFDHVVTHLLNQVDDDAAFGIPFAEGPIRDRERAGGTHAPLAHPTLAHPTLAHPTLAHPTPTHAATGRPSLAGPTVESTANVR